ncbi:MAG TPA: transglutaminase family protein [Chloroflexota bacterium]
MLLRVTHETMFEYSDEITSAVMEVRLRPVTNDRQVVRASNLDVSPRSRTFAYQDYFGNTADFFTVPLRHRRLSVVSQSLVQTLPARHEPIQAAVEGGWLWEYMQFDGPVCRHPELATIAQYVAAEEDLLQRMKLLTHYLHDAFDYKMESTDVDSTLADVLTKRSGVCQDFAHLMIGVCREMGMPARYVSGYIFTAREAGVRGQDASHAWCQVYIPGADWVGFDPTNDLVVDERYVEVAIGRDYRDVAPTKGIYRGSATEHMSVAVHTELDDGRGAA